MSSCPRHFLLSDIQGEGGDFFNKLSLFGLAYFANEFNKLQDKFFPFQKSKPTPTELKTTPAVLGEVAGGDRVAQWRWGGSPVFSEELHSGLQRLFLGKLKTWGRCIFMCYHGNITLLPPSHPFSFGVLLVNPQGSNEHCRRNAVSLARARP